MGHKHPGRQTPLTRLHIPKAIEAIILGQQAWLFEQHAPPEIVEALETELAEAFEKIREMPQTWPLVAKGSPFRRFGPTERFDYIVYYAVLADGSGVVVNVYHPKQDR